MPTKPTRVYWDSCVYIDCIQKTPGRFDVLKGLLREAEHGGIILVASALVVAEVVKLNACSDSDAEQASRIRSFFENDYIQIRADSQII